MNKPIILQELKTILNNYYKDTPRIERIIKVLELDIAHEKLNKELEEQSSGDKK